MITLTLAALVVALYLGIRRIGSAVSAVGPME